MSDVLKRIKQACLSGSYAFSEKARLEMESDDLTESDVIESIVEAGMIRKTLRSTSLLRWALRERLYVIVHRNFAGTCVYSKGKLVRDEADEVYYFLISSKRAY